MFQWYYKIESLVLMRDLPWCKWMVITTSNPINALNNTNHSSYVWLRWPYPAQYCCGLSIAHSCLFGLDNVYLWSRTRRKSRAFISLLPWGSPLAVRLFPTYSATFRAVVELSLRKRYTCARTCMCACVCMVIMYMYLRSEGIWLWAW